jgi:hypothetical protein
MGPGHHALRRSVNSADSDASRCGLFEFGRFVFFSTLERSDELLCLSKEWKR